MSRDLQIVEFVETTLSDVFHVPPWWDKPRWWLVKILGGTNPHDSVKVTRIVFNSDDFMSKLWEQKRYLYDHFNREHKTLLIGAEDFEEMMSTPAITQALVFSASFNYGAREIYWLTVKVIPWMRGVLVMP